MLEGMLRVLAEIGSEAAWIMMFFVVIVVVFVLYVRIALFATRGRLGGRRVWEMDSDAELKKTWVRIVHMQRSRQ